MSRSGIECIGDHVLVKDVLHINRTRSDRRRLSTRITIVIILQVVKVIPSPQVADVPASTTATTALIPAGTPASALGAAAESFLPDLMSFLKQLSGFSLVLGGHRSHDGNLLIEHPAGHVRSLGYV